ncbi:protein FAR1-RELATED SEQUENCE 5-like [Papaver somniferum]|uniref:protein FAR1-RELATED SEQUENCE 5-like n=1 Tax=Papaver somniferum TaxID=3469 RepID=UPI000E702E79|nr:protein FAR1-RELATED SEQUENCE 5-like [Papaver somniferum]
MNTTGRSEGENAFFKEFLSPKTNLREFVIRYDQALTKVTETEIEEDYVSEHKNRLINENNLILKHATSIYTRNIFEKFHEQLVESLRFRSQEIEVDGVFKIYLVRDKEGPAHFTMKLKPDTNEAYCTCTHFQFMGLPCKHVLRIFNRLEIEEIPPHFILKRWLKGANLFRIIDGTTTWDKYGCADALRLTHLWRISTQVWSNASKCDNLFKIALAGIETISTQLDQEQQKQNGSEDNNDKTVETSNNVEETVQLTNQGKLLNPITSQTMGRPIGNASKTGRIMSGIEIPPPKK